MVKAGVLFTSRGKSIATSVCPRLPNDTGAIAQNGQLTAQRLMHVVHATCSGIAHSISDDVLLFGYARGKRMLHA